MGATKTDGSDVTAMKARVTALRKALEKANGRARRLERDLDNRDKTTGLTPDQKRLMQLGEALEKAFTGAEILELWRWEDAEEGDLFCLLTKPEGGGTHRRFVARNLLDALLSGTEEKKHCPRCNRLRPLSAFARHPGRSDGRQWRCRQCRQDEP